MSYFSFPKGPDGNVVLSDQSFAAYHEYMAEQSRMQTLLLLKLMDLHEDTSLEELEDGT